MKTLPESKVKRILKLNKETDLTRTEISKITRVSLSTISKILKKHNEQANQRRRSEGFFSEFTGELL